MGLGVTGRRREVVQAAIRDQRTAKDRLKQRRIMLNGVELPPSRHPRARGDPVTPRNARAGRSLDAFRLDSRVRENDEAAPPRERRGCAQRR